MLGAFQGWAVRVYKPRSFGNCSMSLPKPFNVFLANKSLRITGTTRPVMGRATHCWPPWHCPHLAGLHCIYKWHFSSLFFFSASFGHCISHCGASRVSWHELRFTATLFVLRSDWDNTIQHKFGFAPRHTWHYFWKVRTCEHMFAQRDWQMFFFSPPPPSLFHMSANTVMHTVSARSNCEPGSISIFSSAGSGPASVNRWTSLQAAWPSMAYSPSGSPVSLKSQPLFYFEHDVFSLHVSRFDYVSMTLVRNLILK